MPLFGNKFSPKKPPSRKSSATAAASENLEEMVSEERVVKLKLGEQETVFRDGEWVPGRFKFGGVNSMKIARQFLKTVCYIQEAL